MDEIDDLAPGRVVNEIEAVHFTPIATIISDQLGRLITANQAWRELTGEPSPPDSEAWLGLLDADNRRLFWDHVGPVAPGTGVASLDLLMSLPVGPRWTRWFIRAKHLGPAVVLIMSVVDIHGDVSGTTDLRNLAMHDDLTGLFNRRFFIAIVEQALRRSERYPELACLLYIDLDGFKDINNEAGHAVGDIVLKDVAARLRRAVRGCDIVGRIGGDEFAILLDRVESNEALELVVRRVESSVGGRVNVAGKTFSVSASIGACCTGEGRETAAELLARADDAMYTVKRSRRRRPTVEQSEPPDPTGEGPDEDIAIDLRTLTNIVNVLRESIDDLKRELPFDVPPPPRA